MYTFLATFVALLVLGGSVLAVIGLRGSTAFRRLAESRSGQGFAGFSRSMPEVPEEIKQNVYDYVQINWAQQVKGFAVCADDVILSIYPIGPEELEDALRELPKACGKMPPLLNVWAGGPVETVGDLARLMAHLPTQEEVKGEGVSRLWTDAR